MSEPSEPDRIVIFNDEDMPDDAWLDFYHAEFPRAEFRRSRFVESGKAYVIDPSILIAPWGVRDE